MSKITKRQRAELRSILASIEQVEELGMATHKVL